MSYWTTVSRVARYGFVGFIRNGFVSLAGVLIMMITLFVVAGLMLSGAALNSVLQQLTDKVDVTVYFATNASEGQVMEVKKAVEALPQVASVVYVSREAALSQFQARHQNDQLTMRALEELGGNPLGASLEIRAKDTSQYEAISTYLINQQAARSDVGAAIEKVNFSQNKTAIDRLTTIIQMSKRLGLVVALVLGLASLLIAFNTIRLAIYTSRDEIGIMNLVGASHWFVRGPFVISGVLYGAISGTIVLLLLYPLTLWLGPGTERFLGTFNVFTYYIAEFPQFFVVIIGSGIAFGALSSYLAVRRYLDA